MGQINVPSTGGINVAPIDREAGPGAGGGASGNRDIFLGLNAGFNSVANDFIAIGNLAGSGALANASTLVIGSGSLKGANVGAGANNDGSGLVVLGHNSLTTIGNQVSDSVYVGNGILALANNTTIGIQNGRNVVIGNSIYGASNPADLQSFTSNVLVGYKILNPASNALTCITSVILGASAGTDGTQVTISKCVIIGASAQCLSPMPSAQDIILIGSSASATGATTIDSTVIGNNSRTRGPKQIIIGNLISSGGVGAGCTSIGHQGNQGLFNEGQIIIGTNYGQNVTPQDLTGMIFIGYESATPISAAFVWGDMVNGNFVLGASAAAQRDFTSAGAARNCLKLINGVTAGALVNGAHFYVVGGVMHAVSSAGVDTQLTVTVAGQLAANAIAAYSNNAGAQAATITNGPLAGNPTKWIPINDNGTIRNIPAW